MSKTERRWFVLHFEMFTSDNTSYNVATLAKFKKRVLSMYSRFESVLEGLSSEAAKSSLENLRVCKQRLEFELPSDRSTASMFAETVMQPYDQCPHLRFIGYPIVMSKMTEKQRDMIDDFIHNTCSIVKKRDSMRHPVHVEARQIVTKMKKKEEEKKQQDSLKTISELVKANLMTLADWMRMGCSSDEEAGSHMRQKMIGACDHVFSLSKRVPDSVLPKAVHFVDQTLESMTSLLPMCGVMSSNDNDNASEKSVTMAVKGVRKTMKSINSKRVKKNMTSMKRAMKESIPEARVLSKTVKTIRNVVVDLANRAGEMEEINKFGSSLKKVVESVLDGENGKELERMVNSWVDNAKVPLNFNSFLFLQR